jgi:single-strand DNA-binding protein
MHVITGEIRKEPRLHNGSTFIVDLTESFKNKDGEREYTNYTFFFKASSDGLMKWYQEAFQLGKVISVTCEKLKISSREHNGTIYNTLQSADFARLEFSQFGGGGQQSGGGGQQSGQQGGWGQPHQPQQNQQRQQPQQNQQNFDDDIPF